MIGYFVRHPVAANLLMAVICILGLSVLNRIERETFPAFDADAITIAIGYPGAAARDVDEEICAPLDDAMRGLSQLEELECRAMEGRAVAVAEMAQGGDLTRFFNAVFSAVSGVGDFPDDATTPNVEIRAMTDLVAMVAVSGVPGREGLLDYAETLADRLLALPGVAEATVSGVSESTLRIGFDAQALRRFGMSARSVVAAIEARSLSLPLGSADLEDGALLLRYAGARRSVAELENLILREDARGGLVRLRDIAAITLAERDENRRALLDGAPAAIIAVAKASDRDSIRVFDAMDALLEQERAAYPAPFRLTIINNITELVQERLSLIVTNTALGLVLVFGTMWLFFSLREALWISAALPVSLLGALFVMQLFGVTINMITLVALLMTVGLIMDDSIVIAENIDARRGRAGPLDAAADGAREVSPGVVSSFLTTACVFGPLMFLDGRMGQVLQYIPMVLLMTLSISLIEGFLILPHHLSHGRRIGAGAHASRPAARLLDRVKEDAVLPLAGLLVRWRYLALGGVAAALILSIGLVASGRIKVIGFPAIEGDTVIARVALTSGIARERTEETVARLLAGLETLNDRYSEADGPALVERVLVQYGVNSDVDDNGANTATVTVDLLASARRPIRAEAFLAAWREATGPMPDLVQASFAQAMLGPGGRDLDVELLGRDPEALERAAAALTARLLAQEGVLEAYPDLYGGRQELRLRLTEQGYALGLTPQALAAQLRDAFAGAETDSFSLGPSSVTVRAELDQGLAGLSELERFPVALPDGAQTALATVAALEQGASYPVITRRDGLVSARIRGRIDRALTTPDEVAALVTDRLAPALATAHPGVTIGIGGASEDQAKSQASMMRALTLGLIGVYIVLAFQFRSYLLPLVVMTAIPFALIGAILGHWAMGLNLSMPSFIGFASLAGIVVNNAILFLAFFQTHVKDEDHVSAALEAVRNRFRPVLLSTATTVAGLVPIISDASPQVQVLSPLVVSVASGLLASMLLVALVLPAVLSVYFDLFSLRRWMARFEAD